jgi:gas vesicle protein
MAEDNKGQSLACLLAGLGIGALVGIFFAPKSGRETREDIVCGARDGTEYLRTRTRQAVEQIDTLMDKGKEQVGDYVGRGRSFVNDQSNRVTAAVEAGREAYRTTESSRG